MMKKNLLVALLLGLVMSVGLLLLSPGISAEATDTQPVDNETVETAAEGDTDGAETTNQDAESEPGGEQETTPETAEGEEDEPKRLGLSFWISMGVLALLIIIGVVVGIRKRESLGKWWRSYKSELNKIVWMPWGEVRKNTVVVIVVVVAIGVLIGLLDYVFSRGIIELGNIVRL